MVEVKLTVTVQVDLNEVDLTQENNELSQKMAQEAARTAILNAIVEAEHDGFIHPYAETLSVGLVDVEAMEAYKAIPRRDRSFSRSDSLVELIANDYNCSEEVAQKLLPRVLELIQQEAFSSDRAIAQAVAEQHEKDQNSE